MPDSTAEVAAKVFMMEKGGITPPVAGVNTAEAKLIEGVKKADVTESEPLHVDAGVKPPNKTQREVLINANTETRDENGAVHATANRTEATNWNVVLERVRLNDDLPGLLADINLGPLVRGAVNALMEQNPDLKAQWQVMGQGNQDAVIISLLQNKTTKAELVRLLNERFPADKLITDNLEELRRENKRLTDEKGVLEREKGALETKKDNLEIEAKKFQSEVPPGAVQVQRGEYVQKLQDLQREAEPIKTRVTYLTERLNSLETQISTLESQLGGITSATVGQPALAATSRTDMINRIGELKRERTNVETNLGLGQYALAEKETQIKAINDRQTAIQTEQTKVEKRLTEIETRLEKLNPDLAKKSSELHQAETARAAKEVEFISSITSILPEAVAKTINERTKTLVNQQKEIEQKAIAEAKTAAEKTAREKVFKVGRTATGKMNWDNFDDNWKVFTEQGAEALLDNLIGAGVLKDNKEAYDKLLTDLKLKMGRLRMLRERKINVFGIHTFLRGPEPLSKGEVFNIIDNLGEDYLRNTIKQNKDINALMKEAGQGDVLNGSGKLSEKLKKMPLGLLLLLLPFILAFGPLFGRRKE